MTQRILLPLRKGTTGALLTVGGGTLTFGSDPLLPTLAAGQVYPITLGRLGATPVERVLITSYTSGSLSAPISRSAEGTSAAEHPTGTPWALAPGAPDFEAADWGEHEVVYDSGSWYHRGEVVTERPGSVKAHPGGYVLFKSTTDATVAGFGDLPAWVASGDQWEPHGTVVSTLVVVGGLLDEDDMASDSATRAPSQQSVKTFVEDAVGSYPGHGPYYLNWNGADWDNVHEGGTTAVRPTGVPAHPYGWVVWSTVEDNTYDSPPPLALSYDEWKYHKDVTPVSA